MPAHPASRSVVLELEAVSKRYGLRPVLQEVGFRVGAGERVALTGPSGSGKSTLLNCLGGVDRPDQGLIRIAGVEITALDDTGLSILRRERIGTVFQFFHLLPTLSAAENIELPLQLLGVPRPSRASRVDDALRRVGVAHRRDALPSELSGGEQQRVAIARALVHRPALLLADEPTGNLDSANGRMILDLLREVTDETGTALVLVTHSDEAAAICHRTLRLHDGQLQHAN
jgi:putative ABC transport system ATP-binding protein